MLSYAGGAVALKRYRSHPMMLIGDEPQSYPSYRDIAFVSKVCEPLWNDRAPPNDTLIQPQEPDLALFSAR